MKNSRVKITFVAILVVFVILFATIYLYNPIEVKAGKITVEYGNEIPTDSEFYVKNHKNVDIKVNTKKIKDRDFEDCGEYEVVISKDFFGFKKEKKVKVEVVDTTIPKFDKLPNLETVEGTEIDFLKYVSATDLSGIKKLEADSKTYDFNKVGEYDIKFCAVDNNGNKCVKTCKLKVLEKQKDSEVVFTTDKKGNLVATQKSKYVVGNSSKGEKGGKKKGVYKGSVNMPNVKSTSIEDSPDGHGTSESGWHDVPQGWD